jgi:hypothetical protein
LQFAIKENRLETINIIVEAMAQAVDVLPKIYRKCPNPIEQIDNATK